MRLLLLYGIYAVALNVALRWRGVGSTSASAWVPPSPISRIAVVGATGGTGRALLSEALKRGYTVTAVARRVTALDMKHQRLHVVQGNVLDGDSLLRALAGQDAVVSTLGHHNYFYPTRTLSRGTSNIVAAMRATGVHRLICQTSLGIGHSAGRMGLYYSLFVIPVILPFYFWDKARQEQVIAASRLAWTIVRPVALSNGPSRRCTKSGDVGSVAWTHHIPRVDVANFLLDQLGDDQRVGVAVGVSS